jgi:hypothetical protein
MAPLGSLLGFKCRWFKWFIGKGARETPVGNGKVNQEREQTKNMYLILC